MKHTTKTQHMKLVSRSRAREVEGFVKNGIDLAQTYELTDEKGGVFLAARVTTPGRPAAELLCERRDGNRRYLRANDRHPLFRPVREIVLKTDAHVPAHRCGHRRQLRQCGVAQY